MSGRPRARCRRAWTLPIPGWQPSARRSAWRPSLSRRCRCWESRAGGGKTRTFLFTMTQWCSGRAGAEAPCDRVLSNNDTRLSSAGEAASARHDFLRSHSMKRIFLFLATNLAVVVVLGIVASLLGVNRYLTANGLNLGALLGFAFIMGFGGAIISLLLSKTIAKWSSGVQLISGAEGPDERWIVDTVRHFADKAG